MLLGACSPAWAQPEPEPSSSDEATPSVRAIGHLRITYVPGEGEAVHDVVITVTPTAGGESFVGVTDDVGWVGITGVPAGEYLVRAPASSPVAPVTITVAADEVHAVELTRPSPTTPPPSPSPSPPPATATPSPDPTPAPTATTPGPPPREETPPPSPSPPRPAPSENDDDDRRRAPSGESERESERDDGPVGGTENGDAEAVAPPADPPPNPAPTTPAPPPPSDSGTDDAGTSREAEPVAPEPEDSIPATGSQVARIAGLAAAFAGLGLAALAARRHTARDVPGRR